ncbi:MAG: AMP-binding protein [Saccharospirillaceae bacterium]|nr:AMP-binding protein [Pseudomonadales bacterium]NRB78851.1 AMP-binding protein [Saccharospirillaceae bacterium]
MSQTYFLKEYPAGMKATIDPESYSSVVQLFDHCVKKFATSYHATCMGQTLTYAQLDEKSAAFAAYLQNHTSLMPGDRIAIQLPNLLQFPVVAFGALRAGLVLVNTNPLYTASELEHQFKDSGAKALIVYEGMAKTALSIIDKTDIEQVIVTKIADFHSPLKRILINSIVKYVKKLVPKYNKAKTVSLNDVLKIGENDTYTKVDRQPDDVILLQYTGGTTGVPKGAMLTNRNMIANMLQSDEFFKIELENQKETIIAPLPLYHCYAFTVNCLLITQTGNHNILIPNPRDISGYIKTLRNTKFTAMTGLNTLFNAMMNHKDFNKIDFSKLHFTLSGGMALMHETAIRWQKQTGCPIYEGYGMTETSPVVSFNPPGFHRLGTIGIPAPSTEVKVVDDDGNPLEADQVGELYIRGPQVMKGYWNKPEETEKVMSLHGWLKSGDMAKISEDGYITIVDRKKDMIIVSGFNVYPNEVEDIVTQYDGVVECAAIGVVSEETGEAVKIFIVASKPINEAQVIAFCRERLTAYKVPRIFEFRDELPKTNVGKVLRRALR